MVRGPLNLDLLRLRPHSDVMCLLIQQRLNKHVTGRIIPKEGMVFNTNVPGSKCPVPIVSDGLTRGMDGVEIPDTGALISDMSPILRDLRPSVVVLLAVTVTVPVPSFDCLTTVLSRA